MAKRAPSESAAKTSAEPSIDFWAEDVSAKSLRSRFEDEEKANFYLALTADSPVDSVVILGESFERKQGTYDKDARAFVLSPGRRAQVSRSLVAACKQKAAYVWYRCRMREEETVDGRRWIPHQLMEQLDVTSIANRAEAERKLRSLQSAGGKRVLDDADGGRRGSRAYEERWLPLSKFLVAREDAGLPLAETNLLEEKIRILEEENRKLQAQRQLADAFAGRDSVEEIEV